MDAFVDPTVVELRDLPTLRDHVSPEEWDARVDLAAIYRLVCLRGWNRGIFNHAAMRSPENPNQFFIKAHPLNWSEVTASNLVKVDLNTELDESANVNRPGFVLHSAILRARPEVNATIHIHPPACIAVSMMKDGLLPLTQQSIFLYGRVGYHDYEGITEDADERSRIVAALGDKAALLMRSHGATTVGAEAGHAVQFMGHLIAACEMQLRLMASGAKLVVPSQEICDRVAEQHSSHNTGRGTADWPAQLRELDQADPGYRD